ncbi:hypothetical protein QYE76_037956 [Lolium multiflorum]|uniref:Uncharacterized protein n=1 Tax=Lolium multiflorum TaxID=4521 RepID=A0AAD8T8M8_LOLMU|nr:hypothetical protein QYE76_037956 [Lolium multiflorum]
MIGRRSSPHLSELRGALAQSPKPVAPPSTPAPRFAAIVVAGLRAITVDQMDYLKTVVPSRLMAERGANLVVINPGSTNVRMGFASQDVPFNVPHCIARHKNDAGKLSVRDQVMQIQGLFSPVLWPRSL